MNIFQVMLDTTLYTTEELAELFTIYNRYKKNMNERIELNLTSDTIVSPDENEYIQLTIELGGLMQMLRERMQKECQVCNLSNDIEDMLLNDRVCDICRTCREDSLKLEDWIISQFE